MSRSRRFGRRRTSGAAVCFLVAGVALAGCARGEADAPEPTTPQEVAAQPAAPPAPAVAAATGAPAPNATPEAPEAPLAPEQIPPIVARIGAADVTRADLLARAAEARASLAERGVRPPPPTRSFYRSVLDDIIGNRLLYADLAARGLAATNAEIDQRVQEVRDRYASQEAFEDALAERGFDPARLRAEIAEGLTVQRWVQQTVIPSLDVTDEMARQFYDANAGSMVVPESVRVSHLLVAVAKGADEAMRTAARRKAEALRARILAGEELSAVARQASDDRRSAERGGELGWIQRGQTPPAFEEVAFGVAPGSPSQLFETSAGFHVLQVSEKRPGKQLTFEEARQEIDVLLRQRLLEIRVRETIQELAKRETIEVSL